MVCNARKTFRTTVSVLLVISMFFSLTGCKQKVRKIDPERMVSTIESEFDISEASDGGLGDSYYSVASNVGRYQTMITAFINRGTMDCIEIHYQIFTDTDEAEDHFAGLYRQYYGEENFYSSYKEGKHNGYYIRDNGGFMMSSFYYDDMVIDIAAYSEDRVEEAKAFIEALGLPVE